MIEEDKRLFSGEQDTNALRKRILGLETLLELTRSMVLVQDRKGINDFLLLTVMGLFSVPRAILLTLSRDSGKFDIYAHGLKEKGIRESLDLSPSGPLARRLRVAKNVVELDMEEVTGRDAENLLYLKKQRIHLAAPIRGKGKLNGILLLGKRISGAGLSSYEGQMLRSILGLAGIVMDNADLYDEMRTANLALEASNERLTELDKLKNEFLANMSHEFRTPITCIIGFAECLRYPDIQEKEKNEFTDHIIENGNKLSNLINQVLDLSEMSAHAPGMDIRKGNLNDLVQEVAESLRADMEEKGLTLELDLKDSLPESYFDPKRTRRVVQNLMDNAIKFSRVNGNVGIRSSVEGDLVALSVEDNGDGIPEDAVDHIFERFNQADGSETRTHSGVGIGLSLVKEIMEGQSGTVSVDSNPGSGSVFTIRLPKDQLVASTSAPSD